MTVDSYSALTDACKSEPELREFIEFRIEDIGNARDWPVGHESEVFKAPSPEDVDELVRRIRHEAGLRGSAFRHARQMAARSIEVAGL